MSPHASGLAAVCTLALFLVGGAAAQGLQAEKSLDDGWYQIALAWPDRHFSFQLPQAPKHRTMQNASGAGTRYAVHVWSAQLDDRSYSARMSVLPGDIDVTNPRRNLKAALDVDVTLLQGGKYASIEWKEHQGTNHTITAVDAVGRTSNGRDMRVWRAMNGPGIFTLTYLGPPGTASSADVNRFIASVRAY